MKIGIIGASDIAYNRFLPTLKKFYNIDCVVASKSMKKIDRFRDKFDCEICEGYDLILNNAEIEAIYISLPPALHFEWGKKALLANKHVLMEKPFTLKLAETVELIEIARRKKLALHENYMFQYHNQLSEVKRIIESNEIGAIQLIQTSFSFPNRGSNDFRYNRDLGGGALMDAGGYTIKLASILLGDTMNIKDTYFKYDAENKIDMYGSLFITNSNGVICNTYFGMNSFYQCKLEIIGEYGKISADRIYTAPAEYEARVIYENQNGICSKIFTDDHLFKSIEIFVKSISNAKLRNELYNQIIIQSSYIEKAKLNYEF